MKIRKMSTFSWILAFAAVLVSTVPVASQQLQSVRISYSMPIIQTSDSYMIVAHPFGMVGPNENAVVSWTELTPLNGYFRFGTSPGNYALGSVPEDGETSTAPFVPSQVGLGAPGIYYGVITDSPDATISADENRSAEFPVIIEAQVTADVIGPKGTVTTSTPTFEWQSVDGVPYYHIIVSDSPIQITEDENGQTVVQGANIIWQAITPNTSIQYGAYDPSGFFDATNGTPPPLMSGITYNYLILNNYGNHPAFTSAVQGGVIEFVVDVPSNLPPPQLVAPADSSLITGDVITFQWDEVVGAVNYKVSVFELREENGSTVSFPVWETTTTNTLVDFPASNFLINADYIWKVLAWDETGGGVQSENFHFSYATTIGTMQIYTRTTGNTVLPRVEITVTAIEGSSDLLPLFTDDGGKATKVMRDGTYELTATKDGYEDTTVTVVLPVDDWPDSTAGDYTVTIKMAESPASISGRVYDTETSKGIADATVTATHITNGTIKEVTTDADGNFLIGVSSGSWDVYAKKTGYTTSATQTVTVSPGNSVNLGQSAFGMRKSSGTLSGVVRNSNGQNLQGATVQAYTSTDTVQTVTASNGSYQMTLTTGTWTVNASKTGYVTPEPVNKYVPADGIATADFSLVGRANLVSGYVTDGTRALSGATVTATPDAGAPVTTTTNGLGQYSLSLGSGTFSIAAAKSGYTAGDPVQVSVTVGETVSGVDLQLSPNPSEISGRVTTDGVTGVAGATVTNGVVSTTTTSNGNFTLSLPEGTHTVYASKDGYSTSESQTLTLTPGQTLSGLDFRVTPNAATISGVVLASGLALYDAEVEAAGDNGTFYTRTDAQGQYSISLEPGSYTVIARKNGYLDPDAQTVLANPGQSVPDIDFTLILNKATISGIAKNASGDFLRNVTVIATDSSDASNRVTTTTNTSGEYTMKVTAGTSYSLTAEKEGYSSDSAPAEYIAAQALRVVNFSLSALPSSVAGVVRDENGAALANVSVSAGSETALTNHLGKYTLYLSAGEHSVSVEKTGYRTESQTITLNPGQTLTGVDFRMTDITATVRGTVSSGNEFIEGAVLNFASDAGNATATTNSQGSYLVSNLLPGAYTVTVTRSGYKDAAAAITVAEQADTTLNIEMEILTGAISGTVTTADGSPLSEATVRASGSGGSFTAISDAQGAYVLSGLPQKSYTVTAQRSGYTSPDAITNIVPDSNGVDFSLIPNKARLAGTVKSGTTLLENARVSVRGALGNTGTATTGANGNFVIENLAADTYEVDVVRSGFFMADSSLSVILAPGASDSLSIEMDAVSLRLSGKVLSDDNLPQADIPIELRGGSTTRTTTTNADGAFSFGGLEAQKTYTLATKIFKAGYSEADTTVALELSDVSGVVLKISIQAGVIRGNVGVASVSISAVHNDGRTFTAVSKSAGDYSIKDLPAGTYTVTASRAGFDVSPEQVQVQLSSAEEKEANFTLTANTGSISGTVADASGSGMSGVLLTAVTENRAPETTTSDADGKYSFTGLPAGVDYTVRAEANGFVADPVQKTIALQRGAAVTADFTMRKNTGTIAGKITGTNGAGLPEVLVSLQNTGTGQGVSTNTDNSGRYSFTSLPSASYKVVLTKGGYKAVTPDTIVTLGNEQTLTLNLSMRSEAGRLRGVVMYRGQAQPGTRVVADGPSRFEKQTGEDGTFNFSDLPAGFYTIQLTKTGFPPITLPDFEVRKGDDKNMPISLPGARIRWIFTDGSKPLAGVRSTVAPPASQPLIIKDGENVLFRGEIKGNSSLALVFVSDQNGVSATDSVRLAGTYYYTLEKDNYLIPKSEHLVVTVEENEFRDVTVPLVFSHQPLPPSRARDSLRVFMKYTGSDAQTLVKNPKLWVRRIGSDGFTASEMQRVDGGFEGWIAPHSQSGTITYSITAGYDNGGEVWNYSSKEYDVRLDAKGILYRVAVTPGNRTLQRGARTKLIAKPIDDTGSNLASAVSERGTIAWELLTPDSTAILKQDEDDDFRAWLWPQIDGQVRIRVTSTLDGISKSRDVTYTSKTMELAGIDIQAPRQAANSEPLRLTFVATNTDSQTMAIDGQWLVEPEVAGSITEDGLFQPAPDFIGDVRIGLLDLTSGRSQEVSINIYTVIDSLTEATYRDGKGFTLSFQKNSVVRPRLVGLYKPTVPNIKKFMNEYQVVGDVYQLLPTGVSFEKNPRIALPLRKQAGSGEPVIGEWDQTRLEWKPVQASTVSDSSVTAFIESFAQFAVLTGNEPLGVTGLSFMPTPFSPRRGVMRIGYVLTSEEGKALITIRVYSMTGELVRTIADRVTQYPGVHTENDLAWDGLTDSGDYARNGRYLVEVIAENVNSSVRFVKPIVLIK